MFCYSNETLRDSSYHAQNMYVQANMLRLSVHLASPRIGSLFPGNCENLLSLDFFFKKKVFHGVVQSGHVAGGGNCLESGPTAL